MDISLENLHGNINGLKGKSFNMSFDKIDRVLLIACCLLIWSELELH